MSTQNVPQNPPQYWNQYPSPPPQQWAPPPPPPQYYQPVRTGPPNGFGITGFVLGLLGSLLAVSMEILWQISRHSYYYSYPGAGPAIVDSGILLGILAIIFSSIGLAKFRKYGRKNGVAIAGLVLGILPIVVIGLSILINFL